MLGKNFSYRGVDFPWTKEEGRTNGWYADVDWKQVPAENPTQPRQDYHGVIAYPTLTRGRVIEISGQIFSSNKTTRGTIRNVLDTLFRLQDFPELGEGFYDLDFEDDDGELWRISAKVASVIYSKQKERGHPVIDFTVNLFSQDGKIRSQSINEANGIYGQYGSGGVTFPTVFPFALDGYMNSFSAYNSGTCAAEALVTIEGDIVNPKVVHIGSGRFFQLNLTLTAGEVLVIDTANLTAEVDGVNVMADRVAGSNWPYVLALGNDFCLTGDDFDVNDQDKATIKVEWYHTKLT